MMKSKQGASQEETKAVRADEDHAPKTLKEFFADLKNPVFDGPQRPKIERLNEEE